MSEVLTIHAERQEVLKKIIHRLHAGEAPSALKKEFAGLMKGLEAGEIASMEQALMDEGFPAEEVQRLCDVHVEVFAGELGKGTAPKKQPGHPIHTMLAENREARKKLVRLVVLAFLSRFSPPARNDFQKMLEDFSLITLHYARKENQLFPFLERHGFTGPSRVMWGKHDEIRMLLKETGKRAASGDSALFPLTLKLSMAVKKMIFMEEHILLPDAATRLSDREWARIRQGEDSIGFAWIKPLALYDAGLVLKKDSSPVGQGDGGGKLRSYASPEEGEFEVPEALPDSLVDLNVGRVPLGILDLALKTLPVDFSIVDENDRVIYYSDAPHRVFPRSPGVIGRAVQNCHPQKSVATVNRILDSFRSGSRKEARFWIEMGGRMIVIEYHALLDSTGRYRGTLEVSQDATGIRSLTGQRRLLDWE